MHPDHTDIQMLISKYRRMGIEELKSNIDYQELENDCSDQFQNLDIAKKELELRYQEKKNKQYS